MITPFLGPVRGDAGRLQQVVWNLLSNAVKFTPKNGRIEIALARKGSHVEIVVSDTGIGVKADFLPHLFERFRQSDASAARQHGGMGIGLTIVKHLVELHGGRVHAASAGEGQGATFTVELPVALTPAPVAVSSGDVRTGAGDDQVLLGGLKVLAVDDQEDSRHLFKRLLEERSALVVTAASSDEALLAVREHRPDVILCDIGMPVKDGLEFIRQLREQGDGTPALAVTAFARPEDRVQVLRAGYQGHIAKPVNAAELIATVAVFARTVADQAASRRQAP
jgi:CheY-like chemotaxis protein